MKPFLEEQLVGRRGSTLNQGWAKLAPTLQLFLFEIFPWGLLHLVDIDQTNPGPVSCQSWQGSPSNFFLSHDLFRPWKCYIIQIYCKVTSTLWLVLPGVETRKILPRLAWGGHFVIFKKNYISGCEDQTERKFYKSILYLKCNLEKIARFKI